MSSLVSAPLPDPSVEYIDASSSPTRRRLETIDREHAEHPFTVLPFRLVLDILKEFFLLRMNLWKMIPKMTKDIDFDVLRPIVTQEDLDGFRRHYPFFEIPAVVADLNLVHCRRVLYSTPGRIEIEGTWEDRGGRDGRPRNDIYEDDDLIRLPQPTLCQSDWFGFFKLDRCRTIFQIFASVSAYDEEVPHVFPVSVPSGNPRMLFPLPSHRLRLYFPVSLRYFQYWSEGMDLDGPLFPGELMAFVESLCEDPIRGLKTFSLDGFFWQTYEPDAPARSLPFPLSSSCPSLRRIELDYMIGNLFLRPGFSATDPLIGASEDGDGKDVWAWMAVAGLNPRCHVHCRLRWLNGHAHSDEDVRMCHQRIVAMLCAMNPEGEWSENRVSVDGSCFVENV